MWKGSEVVLGGCGPCVCRECLLWWSGRCPMGECWDDHRAKAEPWPGPVRESWSDWDKPGEQAHWCRGGVCYPVDNCPSFIRYDRSRTLVQDCLEDAIVKYQDGYVQCSIIDVIGCEECYRRFVERTENG